MKYGTLFLGLFLVFCLAGTAALSAQTGMVRRTSPARETAKASERDYDEAVGNMTQLVKSVQDDNARLDAKVVELERSVKKLRETNEALQQEVARLKNQIQADAEARALQLKRLEEQLVKLASLPSPVSTSPAQSASSQAEKFEEYIVQEGATLSAIARAFKVTIQDIKKANNLRSDSLRVGQKLLIPVK